MTRTVAIRNHSLRFLVDFPGRLAARLHLNEHCVLFYLRRVAVNRGCRYLQTVSIGQAEFPAVQRTNNGPLLDQACRERSATMRALVVHRENLVTVAKDRDGA